MKLPIRRLSPGGETIIENEITDRVDLCLPSGELNPAAIGWTRSALHSTNLRGWGRNKRFEYWAVTTPAGILSLNISHHDYRANVSLSYWDRSTDVEIRQGGNIWLPGHAGMRDPDNQTPMHAQKRDVSVRFIPRGVGTELEATSPRIHVSLRVGPGPDHESMGVVVPWTDKLFQYTKKDNGLRPEGTIRIDGVEHIVTADTATAVHDRGRGRWPYFTFWNWGAGSGETDDGTPLGLQFGGKWTDGTPSTENWVRIDGHLQKVSEHLVWKYDPTDWVKEWTITGPSVKLRFTPYRHAHNIFNRVVVLSRGDTCFGHYSGEIRLKDGTTIAFSDVQGHAEEVERRW
ncbi:DUF2804 domain-containing protein [Paramicrobacterium chengjingii]|uniref:DUF2804 domain-containing protein n=1 Tax=Paramicrobacterium chengjingii TaxID=2769067 RepID=A0ABX6YKP8_9MICO|nr:DUF2804 domain-containing protein [Microbacterium chengjingii]QPZ39358.1 DUF2804 domain-containing protein [Microbacterium chengjingii]